MDIVFASFPKYFWCPEDSYFVSSTKVLSLSSLISIIFTSCIENFFESLKHLPMSMIPPKGFRYVRS